MEGATSTNATVLASTTVDYSSFAWMFLATDILYKWTPFFTYGYGVFGNFMSIMVTTKKDNRRISTCVYMAGLALVDTGALTTDIIYRILAAWGLKKELEANLIFLTICWYGIDLFAITSGLFLAEMSIDRAIAVIYPMKASTLCTSSRALKITTGTFIGMAILHSQAFFVYRLPDPPNGQLLRGWPGYEWVETAFNTYLLIVGTIVPFTLLIICNTLVIFGVRRAAMERKKIGTAPDKKPKEANLTTMLLITSFAYLVCSSPMRMYDALAQYDMSHPYWFQRYWVQWRAIHELWRTNFAINFYIYFLGGGKKFRRDAQIVIRRCCCCRWST